MNKRQEKYPNLLAGGKIKHGHKTNKYTSPTYISWRCMKGRCNNRNAEQYIDYGNKGIKICERWSKFSNFLEDMGERPNGTTLDRIDRTGNYSKENCRWATIGEQNKNRKKGKFIKNLIQNKR